MPAPAQWADFAQALDAYRTLVAGPMLDAALADDRETFSTIRAGGAADAGGDLIGHLGETAG